MRSFACLSPIVLVVALPAVVCSATQPAFELKVGSGTFYHNGQVEAAKPYADAFGPGLDAVPLPGSQGIKSRLCWTCADVPEGDYYLGALFLYPLYLGFNEFLPSRIHLYVNDRFVRWNGHTEPARPENAAEISQYQAELRVDTPVHLRPGDTIELLYPFGWDQVTAGPVRLYRTPPDGELFSLYQSDFGKPEQIRLDAALQDTQRDGDVVRQPIRLYNYCARPRAYKIDVIAKDYMQRILLSKQEQITLQPGEQAVRTWEFRIGDEPRVRFNFTASAPGLWPDVRLTKFFTQDTRQGPRPQTCLNGEWETCLVKAADPGDAPPADAAWSKIIVPSLQSNDAAHCAWYRKTFTPPSYMKGERIVLRFDQILTEGWVYLNGKPIGHELHGSQPFEIDATDAVRAGQPNELLIAVRDWIAYSSRNIDRVKRGEAPIFKDCMTDVAGYNAAANHGLGGSVWLEGRPAVSVDDVFVVTSVRQKTLHVRYRLANTTAASRKVTVSPSVLDAGQCVMKLPAQSAEVPANGVATVETEIAWPDAKLWWPERPYLYILQTDLKPDVGAADRQIARFGFRELWIDGISFILNGTRVKIRSQWAGGASGTSQAEGKWQIDQRLGAIWDWQIKSMRDRDVQLARTHMQAGVTEATDIADETGLMLKVESECNQVNFTFDQTFWKSVIQHELRVMNAYKNHPSVMMWSAGNENMWGWIYQGEAAKVLGNRWQIKTVKAMHDFDLMKRPVEWEADGDLMGGLDHQALHYPREINQFPDLPNAAWWGPLDGKTVVPYSMGPITLGSKPLTDGEAHWPAVLNRPQGASIIVGDEAYLGGNRFAKAWMESSRFFVNGYRDVEFALIDIYNPLSLIAPQAVVIKQEDRAFFGGRTLQRNLNVHNDLRSPAEFVLRWSLAGRQKLAGDEVRLKLAPAELKRLSLSVPLPRVAQRTEATFRVELLSGGATVHTETRQWTIWPPLQLGASTSASPAVYDPGGKLAALLKRRNVAFTPMKDLGAPEGKALLIGPDALKQAPEGPWREALAGFVRNGGKVAILEQTEAPDFLPTPLALSRKTRTTMAYVRAADHPLVAGLRDDDMRWWADDQYVSADNYRKPLRGNYVPVVDVGTIDGIVEAAVIEEYDGKGGYLLCQMPLVEKAETAPQAGQMLSSLLGYLASGRCYRTPGGTALLASADCPLRKALDDARLVYEDLTGKPEQLASGRFKVAVVDAATGLQGSEAALKAFASAGGHVLVHRVSPANQAAVEGLLGIKLRLFPLEHEPDDNQNHVFHYANAGLMGGVSNHELFWGSNNYLAEYRHEGCWWSGFPGGLPKDEYIADSYCYPSDADLGRATRLTWPSALLQVPYGSGYFVVNQTRLEQPAPDCEVTVSRLRAILLTNLGCTIRSEGGAAMARKQRLQQYEFFTVDLGPHANRGLKDDKAAGLVGWTNQGENDMRALPTGRQTFGGVPFFISSPKAAVVLYSESANNKDLPKEVKGIKVGRRADALFFLHSMAWGAEKPFKYRVNYDDGTSEEVQVYGGRQVIDWWDDTNRYMEAMARFGTFIAWQGDNPMHKGVTLVAWEWVNPHPEKPVRDVDFCTSPENGYTTVPVLAGISGAVQQATEGVVVDVIGTAGIKVKLGALVQDVYYTGTTGIPADHPYYAKAVAAHKALVVGQKVRLVDDVMTQNTAGQRISYVYTGDIFDIHSLVNATIIGDGLGKLGNFEGNNRHRMYLENLGFIASQRKVGMWSVEVK